MSVGVNKIDDMLKSYGYEYKWISGDDVVVSQWVRTKCMYGCPEYGTKGACPPYVPSIPDCREFMREYKKIAIIHFPKIIDDPEKRREWTKQVNSDLVNLERGVFLAGYHKAFMLTMGSCHICKECTRTRMDCVDKKASRPTPEAFGVDVFATARKCEFPINVLDDYGQTQHRYALLLVE